MALTPEQIQELIKMGLISPNMLDPDWYKKLGVMTDPTAPSAVPTATDGGGSTSQPFDLQKYLDMLKNDPMFQQIQANLRAQAASSLAGLQQFIESAIVRYGGIPEGLNVGDVPLDIEKIRALAGQNTQAGTSALARIKDADEQARLGLANNLASRNMLRSGETGYQTEQINKQMTRTQYDVRQNLLDAIFGARQNYANQQLALTQQGWQAAVDALAAVLSRTQNNPTTTTTPTPTPTTTGPVPSPSPAPAAPQRPIDDWMKPTPTRTPTVDDWWRNRAYGY